MLDPRLLTRRTAFLLSMLLGCPCLAAAPSKATDSSRGEAARLVSAFLGDTPLLGDLRSLTDEVGGRATGAPVQPALGGLGARALP